MTQEEAYLLVGRLEWLEKELQVCFKFHNYPDALINDDEAMCCGDYAERLYAYIRTTNDERIIIDCCKIQRHLFYRYRNGNDKVSEMMGKTGRFLYKIHDYTLQTLWGISREDVEKCKYYINSYEGLCRDSETGQLIPRPNKEEIIAVEPQKTGLPLCFDTPEFAKMIAALIDEGLCKNCNGKYKWLKSASLYGYFVLKTSNALGIRPSNERLPWKKYAIVFDEANKMHTTAVNFVSKYNNGKGHLNEPEGYDIILKICKAL